MSKVNVFSKFKSYVPLTAIIITSFLVGCTGGGYTYVGSAQEFVNELNHYYSAGAYDDFHVVKEHGASAYNYAVIYDAYNDEYVAFNLAFYTPGMGLPDYLDRAHDGDIHRYLNPIGNGNYLGDYGMVFEETQGSSKDLEKIGHFIEEKKIIDQGEKIAAEFGLSEERGVKIAKLSSEWTKLKKKRALTDKDALIFSEKVLGFDLKQAEKAYKKSIQGDDSELQDLFKKAAMMNDSTPERMNKVFKDLLNK